MEKQKLIDAFHKNSVEIIKVHVQEWRDNFYFDVRIWHLENPAENGNEKPTHKGITLNIDLLPRLIEALQRAQEEIEENRSERPQETRSPQGEGFFVR